MDPTCEKKINFLQKYVPFLANLIELLANDSEKEGKLAQMQLLYDLLNKPDNSVKIETLEKCEEVLSRVFGSADEKHDVEETDQVSDQNIPATTNLLIKTELPDNPDDSTQQEKVENDEVNYEDVNGCAEHPSSESNEKSSLDVEASYSSLCENQPPDENTMKLSTEENPTDFSDAEKIDSKPPGNSEQVVSDVGEEKTKDDTIEKCFEMKANEIEKSDCTSEEAPSENNQNNNSTDASELCNSKINNEVLEENSLLVAIDQARTDDEILENNYLTGDASSQVDESETFILPDDGESIKPLSEEVSNEDREAEYDENVICEDEKNQMISKDENEEQQCDAFKQSQTDMLPFKIISAESLAIRTVESLGAKGDLSLLQLNETNKDKEHSTDQPENQTNTNGKNDTENHDSTDPLDPLTSPPENLLESPKPVPVENGLDNLHHAKDDEDDDVLLIETRSSPICIDSDPEDEEDLQKHNRSMPIMPSKNTLIRQKTQEKPKPSARKSTSAVMDSIRHIIKHHNVSFRKVSIPKKPQRKFRDSGYLLKKDPKALMETINLIDSDSDDENAKKLQRSKTNDDDVIIVSSTQPQRRLMPTKKTTSVPSTKQGTRFPPRLVNKPIAKAPTAQSNFLNAVNLQPAPKSNSNPASFSARLYNKKVIIPNAFYGNPSYNCKPTSSSVVASNQDESSSNDSVSRGIGSSSTVSIRQVQDRMLKEWLEGFLTNFASPLQLASHACFILLQRVLKYRFFQRLKETRVNLNTLAKKSVTETMDVQMLLDLRNVFIENDNLTEAGRRFCRFATNDAFGKPVTLTTDSRTGKVTCRTRIGSKAEVLNEILKTKTSIPEKAASVTQVHPTPHSTTATVTSSKPVPSVSTTPVSNPPKRSRKLRKLSDGIVVADCDDNDYTPYMGELVPEEEIVTERKKSLRTNRTKRKEAGFTYSEDHDDEEFEALAKKIEDKKREELRLAEEKELEKEREKERKTKKTVAKKTTSKRQSIPVGMQMEIPKEPSRKKLRLAETEILGNADDDLLTPTWVEAEGDDAEVDSLLDFANEPQSPQTQVSENDNNLIEDDSVAVATQESDESDSYALSFDVGTNKLLKNTDHRLHTHSQSFDFCVHCLKRVPRTVHHYVNEHRSSEVFTSRLRTKDIRRLLTTSNVGFVNLYKGNQQQYAAHCIFCDKEVKFLLPYWFEHFTMHTGEYSFKCSGCDIRKPTRSLLTNHLQSGSGCPKKGSTVRLHTFDTKSNQIEAHICSVCNYIQVHRKNILRHLRTQHGIEAESSNHIIRVVLLQVSGPYRDQETISNDESQLSLLHPHSDEEENDINDTSTSSDTDNNSLMIQNDFTDNDDLSFMICGMLDVQTNLSATGQAMGNVDTTKAVDNK